MKTVLYKGPQAKAVCDAAPSTDWLAKYFYYPRNIEIINNFTLSFQKEVAGFAALGSEQRLLVQKILVRTSP